MALLRRQRKTLTLASGFGDESASISNLTSRQRTGVVEGAPKAVLGGAKKEDAETKEQLEESGATVTT